MLKRGLPPIAGPNTRLFILGSLPGDRSLRDGRYYAHPTNHFWRLIGAIAGEDLSSLPYADRLVRLSGLGIGLWDVIGAARREGSQDSAIRDATHNAIGDLKRAFPRLEAIAFNGGAAAKAGRSLLAGSSNIHLYDLISSSGLAGMRLTEKIERWRVIARHLNLAHKSGHIEWHDRYRD